MVKRILIMLVLCVALMSCSATYYEPQGTYEGEYTEEIYSDGQPTVNIIFKYGTPYYYGDMLYYYVYRGWYYYPYFYSGHWYYQDGTGEGLQDQEDQALAHIRILVISGTGTTTADSELVRQQDRDQKEAAQSGEDKGPAETVAMCTTRTRRDRQGLLEERSDREVQCAEEA